jgi:hypothetical protein
MYIVLWIPTILVRSSVDGRDFSLPHLVRAAYKNYFVS